MDTGFAGLAQPALTRLIVFTTVRSSALITVTVSAPEFVTQSRLLAVSKNAKLGEAPTLTLVTAFVLVLITETLSFPWFTTNTLVLSLLTAKKTGELPTTTGLG